LTRGRDDKVLNSNKTKASKENRYGKIWIHKITNKLLRLTSFVDSGSDCVLIKLKIEPKWEVPVTYEKKQRKLHFTQKHKKSISAVAFSFLFSFLFPP